MQIALRKIYCMHDIQNVLEYFKESELFFKPETFNAMP